MLLLSATVKTKLPFDALREYMKNRTAEGDKYKRGYIDEEEINIYYSSIQVSANHKVLEDGQLVISCRTATYLLVLLALVATAVLTYRLFVDPSSGFLPMIALAFMYPMVLYDFRRQLNYFKQDLSALEERRKAKAVG
jgi:hypothetical protein